MLFNNHHIFFGVTPWPRTWKNMSCDIARHVPQPQDVSRLDDQLHREAGHSVHEWWYLLSTIRKTWKKHGKTWENPPVLGL